MPIEFPLGPALLDGGEEVEFARLDGLRQAEDDLMVRPRQLSHQR